MATFWGRAADLVNPVFSLLCLFVALVVSNFGFEDMTLVLLRKHTHVIYSDL